MHLGGTYARHVKQDFNEVEIQSASDDFRGDQVALLPGPRHFNSPMSTHEHAAVHSNAVRFLMITGPNCFVAF